MSRTQCLLCWLVVCLIWSGCSKQDYPGARRIPLAGKVSYDGEPVDVDSISFLPTGGGEQRVSGGYITDGAYDVPEGQGANVGKYRIEIRWQKRTGKMVREPQTGEMVEERKEGLSAKFNKESDLTVDVREDRTTYDFELKSK